MAPNNLLEIRLSGENISPEFVRVKELGEILSSVEDMLASTMIQKSPHLANEEIVIGLVEVKHGSARYQFRAQLTEAAEEAFTTVSTAIMENDYLHLPGTAIQALMNISSFTRRHSINAEFRAINGTERILAVITPKTVIQSIPLITGETTLIGKIIRIGGKEPKVMVETAGGETIYGDLNEKLALELSPYLYKWVGLEGMAKWNAKDLSLHSFRVTKLTEYRGGTPSLTLRQVSELVGKYLRDVNDVRGLVYKLREM